MNAIRFLNPSQSKCLTVQSYLLSSSSYLGKQDLSIHFNGGNGSACLFLCRCTSMNSIETNGTTSGGKTGSSSQRVVTTAHIQSISKRRTYSTEGWISKKLTTRNSMKFQVCDSLKPPKQAKVLKSLSAEDVLFPFSKTY